MSEVDVPLSGVHAARTAEESAVQQSSVAVDVAPPSSSSSPSSSSIAPSSESDNSVALKENLITKADETYNLPNDNSWTSSFLYSLLLPTIMGMVFGLALQRGRVHEFFFIRDQMLMRRWPMMKMFLAASATR